MDLSGIVRLARKRNAEYGITGIISYQRGHYIQVIEGEEQQVDQLFANIKADDRHSKVTTLIDTEIKSRSFTDWDMKLAESVGKNREFLKFLASYDHLIDDLDPIQNQLLRLFCRPSVASRTNTYDTVHPYKGKNLKLSAWPNLVSIKATPLIINLCAKLVKNAIPYSHLIESDEFGDRQAINEVLNMLDGLDILIISEPTEQTYKGKKTKSNKSFYSKMKMFLNRQSHNGL